MTRRWGQQSNAIDIPFDPSLCSPPFAATDVQYALCEARSSAVGKLMYVSFIANGNTADKFLGYQNASTTSDTLPFVMPFGGDFIGTTFSNQDNNVDIDMLIYKNGVTPSNLIYTRYIRNKRTAWKTNFLVSGIAQGDRISVYLKKYTGGTGDSTAQDPAVLLVFAINPGVFGEGGQQNGD